MYLGIFYLYTCLPIYLSIDLSIDLSIYLCMFLSINQQIIYLSLGLSVCLSIYLSICTLENLAILRNFFIFQVDNIKNAALLRDFLIFWSWLHQTENTSARPPPFLKLTTSKTKQFCETSFIFELNNVKNAALTASCQNVLRFVHSMCLKYCACHEKVMPGHTKWCTCHAKSS